MTHNSLHDQCLQAVHDLVQQHSWPLSMEGMVALVEAILPLIADLTECDAHTIQTLADNYYHDGPMVQQMCDHNSSQHERLWGEWRTYMVKVARSKGMTDEEAVGLVQTLYIETQSALLRFSYRCRLSTYFYGIFNNHFARWVQRRKRVRDKEGVELEENREAGPVVDAPDDAIIQDELRRLVREEVQKMLSGEVYQILYLYYVEQTYLDPETNIVHKWTDKAIGAALDLPLNTVTTKRTRALRHLRQHPKLAQLFQDMIGTTVEGT